MTNVLKMTQYALLSPAYRHDVRSYVEHGVHPGTWLARVLSNNLKMAVHHGSPEQLADMPALVRWLLAHAPAQCWGNTEAVLQWSQSRQRLWASGGSS